MPENTLPTSEVLAVDASEAARLCSMSRSAWYAAVSSGNAPPAVRIGKARRWPIDTLRAWLLDGARPTSEWRARQAAKTAGLRLNQLRVG